MKYNELFTTSQWWHGAPGVKCFSLNHRLSLWIVCLRLQSRWALGTLSCTWHRLGWVWRSILSLSQSNIRWMEGVQLEGKSLHLGARCDLSFGFAVPEAFGLSFSSFGLRDCHLFFKVFFFVWIMVITQYCGHSTSASYVQHTPWWFPNSGLWTDDLRWDFLWLSNPWPILSTLPREKNEFLLKLNAFFLNISFPTEFVLSDF